MLLRLARDKVHDIISSEPQWPRKYANSIDAQGLLLPTHWLAPSSQSTTWTRASVGHPGLTLWMRAATSVLEGDAGDR